MTGDAEAAERLRSALEDPAGLDLRRAVLRGAIAAFNRVGEILRLGGHLLGPDRLSGASPFGNGSDGVLGLGQVAGVTASLCAGTISLIEDGNIYGAAALVRQLVEVEYLCWAFGEDPEEAASWLRSDKSQRLARWQPRHLRERSQGRFRGKDYANHREIGGHPTPPGAYALIDNPSPAVQHLQVWECAIHSTSAWHYLLAAVKSLKAAELVAIGDNEKGLVLELAAREAAWRASDPMFRVGPSIPASDIT